MIALSPRLRHAGLAALLALAACGGGSEAVLLIPLFEFGFGGTTTGGVVVQVFFEPALPTTSSGTFTSVHLNADGQGQLDYTGTWSGCTFSIQTAAAVQAPVAASYTGSFKGNQSIELQPPGGSGLPTLSLQRLQPETKPGC